MAVSPGTTAVARRRALLSTLAGLVLLQVSAAAAASDEERLSIVVSIAPLQYFVREIAGEEMLVRVLVEPGSSPHTWEPSARQISALEDAELLLGLGMPFEAALMRRIRGVAPHLRVIDLSAGIDEASLHEGEDVDGATPSHTHAELDPHIWLSPVIAQQIAAATTEALVGLRPALAAQLRRRKVLLQERLRAAHHRLQAQLSSVRGGSIVVLHPAFGHFCREYGIRQIAIQSGGTEPGSRELVELVRFAREHEVRAILVQPQFSARSARKIADEVHAELIEVDPLATDLDRLFEQLGEIVSSHAVPSPSPGGGDS
jgi:zinc transport system substrate-binding protein